MWLLSAESIGRVLIRGQTNLICILYGVLIWDFPDGYLPTTAVNLFDESITMPGLDKHSSGSVEAASGRYRVVILPETPFVRARFFFARYSRRTSATNLTLLPAETFSNIRRNTRTFSSPETSKTVSTQQSRFRYAGSPMGIG